MFNNGEFYEYEHSEECDHEITIIQKTEVKRLGDEIRITLIRVKEQTNKIKAHK